MNIDEAKDFIFAIARKNQIGNIPITQLNGYFERAQLDIVSELRTAFQQTSIISDNLSPLITPVEIYNQGDVFNKPSDYLYWVDLYSFAFTNNKDCGVLPDKQWVPIELIPQNKLAYRNRSTIVPADTMYPVAVDYDKYYLVLPAPSKVQLTYIRVPKKPKWGYIDTPQRPVYDPTTSQDFELPEITHKEICFRVLSFMGIATRDADLYQTTTVNDRPGN
jgi:hypothetical protein